jgi:hypothetical protein
VAGAVGFTRVELRPKPASGIPAREQTACAWRAARQLRRPGGALRRCLRQGVNSAAAGWRPQSTATTGLLRGRWVCRWRSAHKRCDRGSSRQPARPGCAGRARAEATAGDRRSRAVDAVPTADAQLASASTTPLSTLATIRGCTEGSMQWLRLARLQMTRAVKAKRCEFVTSDGPAWIRTRDQRIMSPLL